MTDVAFHSLLSAGVTAFLVLLFARAVWHKLSAFTEFTGFVADYGLVPAFAVKPVSGLIVLAELLAIAAQLVPGLQQVGLSISVGLLLLYATAMGINIKRGHTTIECGCGGAVQPLSWALVLRNAVLACLAMLALANAPYHGLDVSGTVAALASGFTFWVAFVLLEQILSNSALARLTR